MEIKEAIEVIKDLPYSTKTVEAFDMAIRALENSKPMKPDKRTREQIVSGMSAFGCPVCCASLRGKWFIRYCSTCGQKLDWDF